MSGTRLSVLVMLGAMTLGPAAAAQALTGPLAEVGDASASAPPPKAAKRPAVHRAKAATAKRTAVPASARMPAEAAALPKAEAGAAKPAAPMDPVSFGMKWNGSNDNASQARIENLHGGATGTGAELGMKLHF